MLARSIWPNVGCNRRRHGRVIHNKALCITGFRMARVSGPRRECRLQTTLDFITPAVDNHVHLRRSEASKQMTNIPNRACTLAICWIQAKLSSRCVIHPSGRGRAACCREQPPDILVPILTKIHRCLHVRSCAVATVKIVSEGPEGGPTGLGCNDGPSNCKRASLVDMTLPDSRSVVHSPVDLVPRHSHRSTGADGRL